MWTDERKQRERTKADLGRMSREWMGVKQT